MCSSIPQHTFCYLDNNTLYAHTIVYEQVAPLLNFRVIYNYTINNQCYNNPPYS